jgi:hypothetical protein
LAADGCFANRATSEQWQDTGGKALKFWTNIKLFAVLAIGLFSIGIVTAYAQGQGNNNRVDSLRVSITVHGLMVSHSVLKPGNIQVLVDNQTATVAAGLLFRRVQGNGNAEGRPSVELEREDQGNRKKAARINLTPGTYEISLAHSPQTTIRIMVQP